MDKANQMDYVYGIANQMDHISSTASRMPYIQAMLNDAS